MTDFSNGTTHHSPNVTVLVENDTPLVDRAVDGSARPFWSILNCTGRSLLGFHDTRRGGLYKRYLGFSEQFNDVYVSESKFSSGR